MLKKPENTYLSLGKDNDTFEIKKFFGLLILMRIKNKTNILTR